ncbi:hypothetical protein MCAV_05380 [[Mycoplasma] cavipharyngis]|uniref:ATP-binding protein n=1 Tax=[Mycoplasma] cavipharyngis TaxID=92757 RepID=UPI0037041C95
MNDNDKKEISIIPSTLVYNGYKHYSYEPWTAIAEFVDNSTQSYFDNKEQLKSLSNFKKLRIDIKYDEDYLIITDNAFGMEFEDFERAVKIDKLPENRNGRNEFGMGLKTAAFWFGNCLNITTTQYGSDNLYYTTFDIKKVTSASLTQINFEVMSTPKEDHFTRIKITDLNRRIGKKNNSEKRINTSVVFKKIKELLSSIYRQDIRSGEVEIVFNNEILTFQDPDIYIEKNPDGSNHVCKKNIEFSIDHLGQSLYVNGFVAIREKGSTNDGGLVLIRRGRVIVGGIEDKYKPEKIFGKGNDFAHQRVFGELHLDNWPVTQAKDKFDWHNEDLEENFIAALDEQMEELVRKSRNIRKRENKNNFHQGIVKYAEKINDVDFSRDFKNNIESLNPSESINSVVPIIDQDDINSNNLFDSDEPTLSIVFPQDNPKFKIEFVKKGLISDKWIFFKNDENNKLRCVEINEDHHYFENLPKKGYLPEILMKFIFSLFVVSEQLKDMYTNDNVVKDTIDQLWSRLQFVFKKILNDA